MEISIEMVKKVVKAKKVKAALTTSLNKPSDMTDNQAVELVKSATSNKDKWIALDKWISSQADRPAGVTKQAITLGLIIKAEGMDIALADYHKDTVKAALETLDEVIQRLVMRKLSVIKAMISAAHNAPNAAKTGGKDKAETEGKAEDGKINIATVLAALDVITAVSVTLLSVNDLMTAKATIRMRGDIVQTELTARDMEETARMAEKKVINA